MPDICTLPALLQTAAQSDAGVAFDSPSQNDTPSRLAYKSLALQETSGAALLVYNHGTFRGGRKVILIHMDNQFDNIRWFWAAVFAGMTPTISTPFSHNSGQRMQHLLHLKSLLQDSLVLSSKNLVTQYRELTQLQLLVTEDLESCEF